MLSLDDFKQSWNDNQNSLTGKSVYDEETIEKIIRSRVRKNTHASFKYFWASFVLQVIVYALLSHVIIKFWNNKETQLLSIVGILLYIPFTILLMRKFKRMAFSVPGKNDKKSLYQYILQQKSLLTSFYNFKRTYEMFLIPLSLAIGVFLIFKLYVPGGITENITGAAIVFIITILSCIAAIVSENNKSFKKPIRQLQDLLEEFGRDV